MFNRLRTWQGGFGASRDRGIVSPAYIVARPGDADARYLDYVLHSAPYLAELVRISKWMPPSQFDVLWSDLRNVEVPWLPLDEQRRIADFLDDRVARIDQIIAARRRQTAFINEQVRSLPDELLSHVHEPWVRLGPFVRRIEQGWSPQCDAVPAELGEWGVLRVGAVKPGWFDSSENKRLPDGELPKPEYEVSAGDLLVSRANTPERVGFFAVVPANVRARLILCDKIMRVQVDGSFDPNFVALVGQSRRTRDEFTLAGTGTSGSMVNIRGDDVRSMALPLLSDAYQRDLVLAWQQQSSELQGAMAILASYIELFQEYKQSLITAAVTGELDVTTAGSGIPG